MRHLTFRQFCNNYNINLTAILLYIFSSVRIA
jgi:hypothetical protein